MRRVVWPWSSDGAGPEPLSPPLLRSESGQLFRGYVRAQLEATQPRSSTSRDATGAMLISRATETARTTTILTDGGRNLSARTRRRGRSPRNRNRSVQQRRRGSRRLLCSPLDATGLVARRGRGVAGFPGAPFSTHRGATPGFGARFTRPHTMQKKMLIRTRNSRRYRNKSGREYSLFPLTPRLGLGQP
jgi:hypothetical protein